MSDLVQAFVRSREVFVVTALDAHARFATMRWSSPGAHVREWLHRLGRASLRRAEEGRGTSTQGTEVTT